MSCYACFAMFLELFVVSHLDGEVAFGVGDSCEGENESET
jgi:hypothetical protein